MNKLMVIENGMIWIEELKENDAEEIIFEDKQDFEYEEKLNFQEV